jgi:DNA modification methylase
MNIQNIDIKSITPYKGNAKKHDKKQIDNVAESIKQFGFVQPIVVDKDNVIVIGHCRYEAARKLKMQEVPCVSVDTLTPEQVQKLRLLDNKLNESDWDMDLLAEQVPELDFSGFDVDWELPEEEQEIIEDEAPEVDEENEPISKLGDVWQLGRHRLLCGSSTDKNDVTLLMNGQHSKLLFTSPPYSDMRTYNGDKDLSVESIAQFLACYEPFAALQAVNLGIQRKGNEVYPYWDSYIAAAKAVGLKLLAWNVWDKLTCGSVGQQRAMIPIRHEWIFCFGKEPVTVNPTWRKKEASIYSGVRYNKIRQADGSFRIARRGNETGAFKKMESLLELPEQTSLESVTKQLSEKGKIRAEHPATFPVALPSEYIVAFTDEHEIVVEPFGGAGTTLIACEQLDRTCYIMELDARYCDVIIKRWENFTGEKAKLITE